MTVESVFSLLSKEQNAAFRASDNIVLLTFDDNYLDQSINLILSIAKQHPQGVSYICICPQLRPESISALLEIPYGVQVRCYNFAPEFNTGRWSSCAVLRLFCPWLLEEEIHRVVYMDSDILCSGSIQALFDMNVPCIAMAGEVSGNVSLSRTESYRAEFPTQVYCNSGVVVFNLDYLRQAHTFAECYTELSAMLGTYYYLDQDFLNRFFMGRIEYLNPYRFNFQAYELLGSRMYAKALRDCRLIHFSVGKPWKYQSRMPLIRLYLKYSYHPAMIRKVKKTMWQRVAYSPIALARRMLSPIKQAILSRK